MSEAWPERSGEEFARIGHHYDLLVIGRSDDRSGGARRASRHLARHGIGATLTEADGARDVAKLILDQARESAADFLVMGRYGHSRISEMVLGGTTRTILSDAPIPVFIPH